MYDDVRELTGDRLQRDLGFLPSVIVGSPPCQEISSANCAGEGITDDHLFWEWARLVFEVRPLWCAAENSPHARTKGIDGILDALDQAGYAAWSCVVGADNAGANHRRKRLWIIAADAHRIRQFGFSRPDRQEWTVQEPSLIDGHARNPEVEQRIRQRQVLWRRGAEPSQADLYDDADFYDTPGRQSPLPDGPAAYHRPFADPDREGLAIGPRLRQNDGGELPPALRDIGLAWPDWNGGLAGLAAACAAAGFGAVDDGSGPGLPAGLRNRGIAALGDAVIPQIPEAIGRAMRATLCG